MMYWMCFDDYSVSIMKLGVQTYLVCAMLPLIDESKRFEILFIVTMRQENIVTGYKEPRPPFWRMKVPRLMLSWVTFLTLILFPLP